TLPDRRTSVRPKARRTDRWQHFRTTRASDRWHRNSRDQVQADPFSGDRRSTPDQTDAFPIISLTLPRYDSLRLWEVQRLPGAAVVAKCPEVVPLPTCPLARGSFASEAMLLSVHPPFPTPRHASVRLHPLFENHRR